MRESKLFEILKKLNLSQKRDLKVFVRMPSNRLSDRDQEIFTLLLERKPHKNNQVESVFWQKVLTPKEQPNANRIKSRLLAAIGNYISLYQLQEETHFKNLLLADFYTKKGAEKNAQAILNRGIALAKKEEQMSHNNPLYLFWYHELKVERDKERRVLDHKLELMEGYLHDFFALSRIRLLCEKANRNRIINGHQDYERYRDEVERLAQQSSAVHNQVYYWIFKLITEQQESYAERLEQFLSKFHSRLGVVYRKEIYGHLMNFCIRRINAGQHLYADQYLRYIGKLEEQGELLDAGRLDVGTLKNAVLAALLMNKLDWALGFIDRWADHLAHASTIDKIAFLELNRAIIELQNNNLEACFLHITNFQTSAMYRKDVYYKITCDKLLLKLYYEVQDIEPILNKIESTKGFIRKQEKLSVSRQQPHLTFLSLLHRIAKKKVINLQEVKAQLLIPDYLWLNKVIKEDNP